MSAGAVRDESIKTHNEQHDAVDEPLFSISELASDN